MSNCAVEKLDISTPNILILVVKLKLGAGTITYKKFQFIEVGLKAVVSSMQLTSLGMSKAAGKMSGFKVMSKNVRPKDNPVTLLTFVRLPCQ